MTNRKTASVSDDVAALYWEAAAEVLTWPQRAAGVFQPARVLAQLRPLIRGKGQRISDAPLERSMTPLDGLQQVAAGASPDQSFPTTAAFAEAVAYARCRREEYAGIEDLLDMRSYLDQVAVPAGKPALMVDHATTREQLSFVALLIEPHRLHSMRASFDAFRSAFASAYEDHHREYWRSFAELTRDIERLAPIARAVDRLNRLVTLGLPLGQETLVAFGDLTSKLVVCPVDDLAALLHEQPTCRSCGITLRDSVPAKQVDAIAHQLNVALAAQQHRLAGEAVRRILARGGERIERFIEIVQAADTSSLAKVLDNNLLSFLEELLAQPVDSPPSFLLATPQ